MIRMLSYAMHIYFRFFLSECMRENAFVAVKRRGLGVFCDASLEAKETSYIVWRNELFRRWSSFANLLVRHAYPGRHLNAMLEVCNAPIAFRDGQTVISAALSAWFVRSPGNFGFAR